ncbi:glycosyltransferase [Microbacterium sp. NPDC058389]|uniref:glycosyltransferase n=1 Tax=Microbacterium sp. NPDC058389 TaxID=3346475 RepID=UPI00364BE8A5
MDTTPLVSIVIPVFNDADVVAAAIRSCLRQTLSNVEVVVVDDASTDDTAEIVQEFAEVDARVRLFRQDGNKSAYQARRVGIHAARGEYLLFLDGDDELAGDAAATTLARATATGADLVQFGVEVVRPDGSTGGPFETRLQPQLGSLRGTDVLRGLFPIGQAAQGQLWRYLFRTDLLRSAYALMPEDLVLPRVNDLPIAFLAAALATSFESVPDRLYRYHFGRGGSGQKVHDLEWVKFYASAIHSIDTVATAAAEIASRSSDPQLVRDTYDSVRLAIIGYTTYYLAEHTREDLLPAALEHLSTRAAPHDIVHATAALWPGALGTLAAHMRRADLGARPVRNVLLTTNIVRTGGISGVLLAQARQLMNAGFGVTVVARDEGSDRSAIPSGVTFFELSGSDLSGQLSQWAKICTEREIDVVIDHHWLYTTKWPAFALTSSAEGVPTIGWAHNFAGRSVLRGLERLEFQTRHLDALAHLVVLSPLDVAFWKLQGMPRVSYLPNPPSPLLAVSPAAAIRKSAPADRPVELIWWGRLEEPTKRVSELVEVASQLDRLGADFRMRIIGPDWEETTKATLTALAGDKGVGDRVEVVGPLYGDDLLAAMDRADVFVNTSVIEGYPLTIPEAQSRGLPIAMYELPWLALVHDNDGVATVAQGEAEALAAAIARIASDPELFATMSHASLTAAERERTYDFATLYRELVTGALPSSWSPEPSLQDSAALIDLLISFAELNAEARRTTPRKPAESPTSAATEPTSDSADLLVRLVTPPARALMRVVPGLHPLAVKAKHAILRR